jgi:hypothetical protein
MSKAKATTVYVVLGQPQGHDKGMKLLQHRHKFHSSSGAAFVCSSWSINFASR